MKLSLSILALAAAVALPAFAAETYVGADIGRSKLEENVGGVSISKNETAWAIFGGYQFHPNFAAELAYRDLGKISEREGSVSANLQAHAVQLSVIGSYPINEQFSVYGRLGLGAIRAKAEVRAPGFYMAEKSDTKTKALVGIGARYAINKQFGIRTEYAEFGKIEGLKLSTFTVGADYSF
ncbi:outer membrane beta-barrel protein [Chitinimonas sp.]|uniref:outer membrane beta-barrel protein n=1 Tax=Chitinimonas sp. TaxID=1934313 RepID=UPI0035B30146